MTLVHKRSILVPSKAKALTEAIPPAPFVFSGGSRLRGGENRGSSEGNASFLRASGTGNGTRPQGLVPCGVFILWFCWFGFNGGSSLSLSTDASMTMTGLVCFNTNLAAAVATCVTMIFTWVRYGKPDVIVSKISVDSVVEAAKKALYTGHIGDGKIFVYNVTRVVKIRTGEEDFAALQDVE